MLDQKSECLGVLTNFFGMVMMVGKENSGQYLRVTEKCTTIYFCNTLHTAGT